MKTAKKTVKLLALFTLVFIVVFIADALISYNQTLTSFPWLSSFVFAALYFGPVLAFEGILYGILVLIEKWKK